MSKLIDNSAIKTDDSRRFWNNWNAERRVGNWKMSPACEREAREVIEYVQGIGGSGDLNILEVGCGSGWLCSELAAFGQVTGTDIANEVLGKSAAENPRITFIAGDFLELALPANHFDVVVSVEVLSHVTDQPAFMAKIDRVLRPGGHLVLATQNRIVLSRWSNVVPQAPGQIRKWVDAKTLRKMLARHFEIVEFKSVVPVGDRGFLRLVNSYKVNKILSFFVSQQRLDALKETLFLGHSLIAFSRKPINQRA